MSRTTHLLMLSRPPQRCGCLLFFREDNFVLVVHLLFFVEGNRLVEFSHYGRTVNVLQLFCIFIIKLVKQIVHNISRLLFSDLWLLYFDCKCRTGFLLAQVALWHHEVCNLLFISLYTY